MTGFQIIHLARETVCQRLPKDRRLQFIKELAEVFHRYERDQCEDQLELPMDYQRFRRKESSELKLEDLDL